MTGATFQRGNQIRQQVTAGLSVPFTTPKTARSVSGYRIVDIGMRMLQPRELYRAQGFPDWYIIEHDFRGVKYAKDKQVARCGNAVPPQFAEALVRANLPELCVNGEVIAA
ncbi:hypothetical protein SEEA0014_18705 [Salmonella enterica subsp. enterica serovar Abony str. 0014]|nr:hypothetical protein SEEA0014_18705 [Salmonella enterica subsp. enterica serovar Abony str. 0014]